MGAVIMRTVVTENTVQPVITTLSMTKVCIYIYVAGLIGKQNHTFDHI